MRRKPCQVSDFLIVGSAGRDYPEGNFHGQDHEETYGVFDTGAYIGAFGAKRDR